jgi:hypothetical protein
VCGVGVLLCGWSGVFPMTVACRPRRSHTIGNGAPPHYVWHRYWPVYTLGYLSNKKRALWTPPRDPPGPPPGPIGRLFSILDHFFGASLRVRGPGLGVAAWVFLGRVDRMRVLIRIRRRDRGVRHAHGFAPPRVPSVLAHLRVPLPASEVRSRDFARFRRRVSRLGALERRRPRAMRYLLSPLRPAAQTSSETWLPVPHCTRLSRHCTYFQTTMSTQDTHRLTSGHSHTTHSHIDMPRVRFCTGRRPYTVRDTNGGI